ncbi:MAG: hypothetical protein P8N24_04340 [Hellea sp.]|nr:hypothetical protein [Hellea sp.]
MNVIDSLESFIEKQDIKIRQKVRNRAIHNSETNLIYAGRKLNELSVQEWEHIVADEEKAIWIKFMKGGLGSILAIAFFGLP